MALRLRRGTNAERLTIIPQEGELVYTTDTKELYAGDGTTVGGNRITGTTEDSPAALTRDLDLDSNNITGIGNINITGTVTANFDGDLIGDVLGDVQGSVFSQGSTLLVDALDGIIPAENIRGEFTGNVLGDVQGSVFSQGSTLLVDALDGIIPAENIRGLFTGNVLGDIQGSVFGDDSTLLVDGINNIISSNSIVTNIFNKDTPENITVNDTGFTVYATSALNRDITFVQVAPTSDLSTTTSDRGKLFFGRNDINGNQIEAIIAGGRGGIYSIVDDGSETYPEANILLLTSGGALGLGTYTPATKLDVRGTASFSGFVQFGSLTTGERTALTAANGMVIYNTTNNKFEGYQNGSWINLDDGTAAA